MKRIVIVGASSGIGYAAAEAYAAKGYMVGITARREECLRELRTRFPKNIEYATMDINDSSAVEILHQLIEKIGGMDIYFHVAGIGYDNPTLDPEREAAIVETNAVGFARMTSAAYRWFREHNVRGQIAALTSVAGTKGIGTLSAYSSSKKFAHTYIAALRQLAHSEKVDVAFTDIRPGWVRTPLLHDSQQYPLEMSVETVTKKILAAIERRQHVCVIDWRWRILVTLWRIMPECIWRHFISHTI